MPARFVAGVDIGASNLRIVIANEDGEIEARRIGPLPGGTPEDVLAHIARTVEELIRGVWIGNRVSAAGVALPGAVDPASGTVASVANMPGWDDVKIGMILETRLGVPVAIENDANAAAIGEGWRGAAAGLRNFAFLALGTGIGGGIVLDGELRRGAHHLAGEVAYMRVSREQIREGGWEHCLEGIVGGRAAARAAKRVLGDEATVAALFDAVRAGDAAANDWIGDLRDYLAMAVANIVSVLDPECVVFGGGMLAAQADLLLEPVEAMVHRCVPVRVRIVQSALGEDAQVIGAVKLALDKLRT